MRNNDKYVLLQNPWILASFYISLFHHLVSSDSPYSFVFDSIALDCGSLTDTREISGRTWKADTNSNFSLLVEHNNASRISPALQPPLQAIPYGTARLSRSQFTYTFSVKPGPKYVRLYFHPTSYSGFNNFNTFFSVKASRYILLSNFSAALHAEALDRSEGFFREFCLNVEDDRNLSLTFTPSPDIPDAYAFINGQPNKDRNKYCFSPHVSINVGGKFISPQEDTGMFRTWSDESDHLTVAGSSVPPANTSVELSFTKIPNYTAPEDVYKTARSMGYNNTINQQYNLTWEFKVDSSFIYLVRLHFCEIETVIQKQNDRVFQIYINNQTAESHADVIYWSTGYGIPVKKDYAVLMGARGNEKVQNLSIALHALPWYMTSHSDAILNGIEIFKLNSSEYNLAGPNPDIALMSPPVPSPKSTKPNTRRTKIGAIVGGTVSAFIVLSFLFFLIFRRRLKIKDSTSSDGASWWGHFSITSTNSAKTQGSTLPSDLCRRFSLAEIKKATNNFDSIFIIGVGGFGNVYKGLLNDGATTVAIKRLNPGSDQGAHEFKTEIEMLSQLRYLHLVSLIGYCYEDKEMILVYDYMARGTLRDHLYKTDNPPILWNQRLDICIGAARGLQYLHSGAKNTIIHRDVKTTNILLDEKWVAKVSDFGLSKIGPTSISKPHISTVVKGSWGYLDPEYYRLQRLTEKSDVYSFGVVLFEVLSARPPVNRSAVQPASLAEWARQCYRNGTFDNMVDPYLRGKIEPDCLRKFTEVAVSCLLDNSVERPSMSDVVWGLEFALQLQETAIKRGGLPTEIDINTESSLKGYSVADSSNDMSSSTGSGLIIGSQLSGMTFTSSDEQSLLSNSSEKVNSGVIFLRSPTQQGDEKHPFSLL
ncbi:hypothetical protein GH714_012462 [Hevea brasiliensis]|uniref:Protein kinase domain-containing protein n=1 Tax=Hevea brasiliensis TaxID=3981 RepID=A0A6A6MIR8_HEVBR|nr:hypothetical protein GH714_012462 [Hevea brasiliensis]